MRPNDLPDFGTVDGKFIELESGFIIPPEPADPNGPLEQLETPDQLEEREKVSNKTVEISDEKPHLTELPTNLLQKHIDLEFDDDFYMRVYADILSLAKDESRKLMREIRNIQIILSEYPLHASIDDIQTLRGLRVRHKKVLDEILEINNEIDIFNARKKKEKEKRELEERIRKSAEAEKNRRAKPNWFKRFFKAFKEA